MINSVVCPKTAIVIVNWNCWEDTIRCINACGHLVGFDGAVIVVDNGSTDSSLKHLQDWSSSSVQVQPTSRDDQITLLEQPATDPLRFMGVGDEASLCRQIEKSGLETRGWYLVEAGKNAGFGAGNNVGLRLALSDRQCTLFWCLNADAIPQPGAWEAIAAVCGQLTSPCVAGSVLLNYDRPDTIQTVGSNFSEASLKVEYQHVNESVALLNTLPVMQPVGYPIGASMVLNRDFIEAYGIFDERYFLYYEEPDLVVRLGKAKQSFICTQSCVYHKGGQTTGGGSSVADRSARADYEFQRSRVILARKIGGATLLLVWLAAGFSILRRLRQGRWDLAKAIPKAFFDGWRSV